MFILYAFVIGLIVGFALGGRASGLAQLRFRWGWIALAGLAIQVALFSGAVTERIGALGAPIYVASSAMVLLALLANLSIPGLAIAALGAACNLAAIVANGGYMPASPGALAELGRQLEDGYSNSTVTSDPALAPLTDIFALPAGLPFANVFSIGDVLIGLGVAGAIVIAMRTARQAEARTG
jgi:Family of unknown function (DUF5317)